MTPEQPVRTRCWAVRIGALLTAAWLMALILPTAREMMVDQAFSYLLIGILLVLLWVAVRRGRGDARRWWRLLALAWTLNLAGNTLWGIHTLLTNRQLPLFGPVDVLYLGRYALLIAAFWRHKRTWADLLSVVVLSTATIWLSLVRPALAGAGSWPGFLIGGAVYPILDTWILYEAAVAAIKCEPGKMKKILTLLAIGMSFYIVANWTNFAAQVLAIGKLSIPALFWTLTDVMAGTAVLFALRGELGFELAQPFRSRIEKIVPLIAVPAMTAILLIDAILNRRWDAVLIGCTLMAALSWGINLFQYREK